MKCLYFNFIKEKIENFDKLNYNLKYKNIFDLINKKNFNFNEERKLRIIPIFENYKNEITVKEEFSIYYLNLNKYFNTLNNFDLDEVKMKILKKICLNSVKKQFKIELFNDYFCKNIVKLTFYYIKNYISYLKKGLEKIFVNVFEKVLPEFKNKFEDKDFNNLNEVNNGIIIFSNKISTKKEESKILYKDLLEKFWNEVILKYTKELEKDNKIEFDNAKFSVVYFYNEILNGKMFLVKTYLQKLLDMYYKEKIKNENSLEYKKLNEYTKMEMNFSIYKKDEKNKFDYYNKFCYKYRPNLKEKEKYFARLCSHDEIIIFDKKIKNIELKSDFLFKMIQNLDFKALLNKNIFDTKEKDINKLKSLLIEIINKQNKKINIIYEKIQDKINEFKIPDSHIYPFIFDLFSVLLKKDNEIDINILEIFKKELKNFSEVIKGRFYFSKEVKKFVKVLIDKIKKIPTEDNIFNKFIMNLIKYCKESSKNNTDKIKCQSILKLTKPKNLEDYVEHKFIYFLIIIPFKNIYESNKKDILNYNFDKTIINKINNVIINNLVKEAKDLKDKNLKLFNDINITSDKVITGMIYAVLYVFKKQKDKDFTIKEYIYHTKIFILKKENSFLKKEKVDVNDDDNVFFTKDLIIYLESLERKKEEDEEDKDEIIKTIVLNDKIIDKDFNEFKKNLNFLLFHISNLSKKLQLYFKKCNLNLNPAIKRCEVENPDVKCTKYKDVITKTICPINSEEFNKLECYKNCPNDYITIDKFCKLPPVKKTQKVLKHMKGFNTFKDKDGIKYVECPINYYRLGLLCFPNCPYGSIKKGGYCLREKISEIKYYYWKLKDN